MEIPEYAKCPYPFLKYQPSNDPKYFKTERYFRYLYDTNIDSGESTAVLEYTVPNKEYWKTLLGNIHYDRTAKEQLAYIPRLQLNCFNEGGFNSTSVDVNKLIELFKEIELIK